MTDLTSFPVRRHPITLIEGPRIGGLYDQYASFLALTFSVLPAGSGQVEKYLGMAGVGAYLAVGIAILLAARKYLIPRFMSRVSEGGGGKVLACGTLLCLVSLFLLIYPLADSGMFGGGGDSDDALNLGARALLNHQYPYGPSTYLGAPVTYLPGSLLLAVPFVILGNAAYQNIFWLSLFLLTMRVYLGSTRQAVFLFWTTLLCTHVWQLLMTGGELLASSIYILLFVLLAMRAFVAAQRGWIRWMAAVLLGIGLASRANYLLLAPIVFAATMQKKGWRETAGYAAATIGTVLVVTLPFWLHDPQTFVVACLREQNFAARRLNSVLPHADLAVPFASVVFALGLSCCRFKNWDADVLSNCALAQAFPVIAVVLLSSIDGRGLDLRYTGYGVHFLFFGVLASWSGFVRESTMDVSAHGPRGMSHQDTEPSLQRQEIPPRERSH